MKSGTLDENNKKIILIGGSGSHGSSAGLWYWNLGENSSVVSSSPNALYIGARFLRTN